MSNSLKIGISIILVIAIAFGGYFLYKHFNPTEPVNNNVEEENKNNENKPQEEIKEEHKISKFAQMYLDIFDDIMSVDTAINDGEFLSIDIKSLDKEYANEELKETTRVFYIDEVDVQDIVEYMKKYNSVIKTSSMEELAEEGLVHKEENGFTHTDGPVLYVSNIKIIREDHFEVSMTKYRTSLAAIFNTYDVEYVDGKWKIEVISSAIS